MMIEYLFSFMRIKQTMLSEPAPSDNFYSSVKIVITYLLIVLTCNPSDYVLLGAKQVILQKEIHRQQPQFDLNIETESPIE